MIHVLCQNSTDIVHDMCAVNTDAKSHSAKKTEKCLQEAERGKKRIYLQACLQQRRHFSHFVVLVDGQLGVEATATLKRLASRLSTKWRQPYSQTCGYVKSRIAITLVHTTHCCIQGSMVPEHQISVQRPQWEDGAGINLFRYTLQRSPNQPPPSATCIPTTQHPKTIDHHRKSQAMVQQGAIKARKGGQGTHVPP